MSETHSISNRQDEDRQAFLRYLPKRIEAFEQRIRRYLRMGWDQAGMLVLRGDVQRLGETSGGYDMGETRQQLRKLAQLVGDHVTKRSTPDRTQANRMLELLASVTESLKRLPETAPRAASGEMPHPNDVQTATPIAGNAAASSAPGLSAGRAEPIVPAPQARPARADKSAEPVAGSIVRAEPTGMFEPDEPVAASETGLRRVYHLSDGNAFAIELGQRLDASGYAVESLATFDELFALVLCLMPHMLLVDASRMSDLAAIGNLRREAQQRMRPQRHIHLVAMAAQRNMDMRRAAHRAGVDLLLVPPFAIDDTVNRLQALHASAPAEMVRVLIVEDNRADAFYAQTVLAKAGMQAYVEHDALRVLESLEVLHPDLVLMDLHMPHANGVEVTMLIRDHPVFAHLPIVFLSGESDPDSQLEATNAGGDDFLFKPIRPKHLVAAVRDRMRHLHPVRKQESVQAASGGPASA